MRCIDKLMATVSSLGLDCMVRVKKRPPQGGTRRDDGNSPLTGRFIFEGFLLFALLGVSLPVSVWAQETTNSTNGNKPDWMTPPAFTYSTQNRIDPFASFLRSQPETQGEDQNAKKALSPLQQVAPTQLKLVGILDRQGADSRLALVELPNGKGYILRPGTFIGRNDGRVTVITKEQVTIKERQTTPWGEEVPHSVVLELPDTSGVEHDQ